jgi:hypothetical protein
MTVTIITYYNYTILYIPFNLMIQMSVRITEFSVGSQQVLAQVLSQQRGPAKCPTHPSSVWSSLEAPGTHGTHGPWPHGEMRISGISAGNEYGIWLNMIEYDWIWLNMACTCMHHFWLGSILVWSSHMQHRTSSHSINDGDHDGSNHDDHGHDALDLVFEWCFSRRHTKWQDPNVSICINLPPHLFTSWLTSQPLCIKTLL